MTNTDIKNYHKVGMIDIEKSLIRFIDETLSKMPFDVIVPIQRKGTSILLNFQKRLLSLRQTEILDNEYLTEGDIKGRRVLLFDDAIYTGHTIQKAIRSIKRYSPSTLKTAVFIVIDKSKWKPDFTFQVIEEKDFSRATHLINEYLISLGRPLDIDHLILEGRISKSISADTIKKSLQKLGEVYHYQIGKEVLQIGLVPRKAYLRDIFRSLGDSVPFVSETSMCKIRLYLRSKKYMSIEPIVEPIIPMPDSARRRQFLRKSCFLSEFSTRKDLKSEILYVDCIRTTLSTQLAKWFVESFIESLEEKQVSLVIESANWFPLEKRYRTLGNWLEECFVEGEPPES